MALIRARAAVRSKLSLSQVIPPCCPSVRGSLTSHIKPVSWPACWGVSPPVGLLTSLIEKAALLGLETRNVL